MSRLRVAVVGATGLVGREILSLLAERRFPFDDLSLFASERSDGEDLEVGNEVLRVRRLTRDVPAADVLFLCATPEVSRLIAEDAAAEGGLVIDLTGAYESDPAVPRAWSGRALPPGEGGLLVSAPGSLALLLAALLRPAVPFGVRRVVATALVSASASGNEAVGALARASAGLLGGLGAGDEERPADDTRAFNASPGPAGACGPVDRAVREAREMLDLPGDVPIQLHVVQTPTFHGQGVALSVEIAKSADASAIKEAFRAAPSILVGDILGTREAVGSDAIHVSFSHPHSAEANWFHLWAASDNLRQGAALNAVAIAEARLSNRPGRG